MEVITATENESKALPSMPLLCSSQSLPGSPIAVKEEDVKTEVITPSQTENSPEKTSPEKDVIHNVQSNPETSGMAYDSIPVEAYSGECDELVIRAENSPFSEKRKSTQLHHQHPPKKKKKLEVFDVFEGMEEEPGIHYAEAYFSKVKSTLDEAMFQKFIAILGEAKDEPGSAVSLYRKLEELFVGHPDLVDDFVGTLKPHQALEIGKLIELKFITRSLAFFRKLEGFQLTKVINALEQISSNGNVSYDSVKTTLLPLLKGHGPMAESFMHLLPHEKPLPPSSIDEYEDITEAMMEEGEDGGYENVRIPEHTERGCLIDCACWCHATPSQPFCLACNIRFIKGQAYVQYGKVIRYCKVHFGEMNHDEVLQRFNPALYSKRKRKRKTIVKPPPVQPEVREIAPPDDNAVVIEEDLQPVTSLTLIEEKMDDEDDYGEEDDVSSGDKSSGGDMFEELDRHSEDAEDRFFQNPLSPLGSTMEGFYLQNALSDESLLGKSREAVSEGVVIDVSDIRPNGVNAHVIKFEKRASDDPCIKAPPSPSDSISADSPRNFIQDATVIFDDCEIHPKQEFDSDEGTPVVIDVSEISQHGPSVVESDIIEGMDTEGGGETPVVIDVSEIRQCEESIKQEVELEEASDTKVVMPEVEVPENMESDSPHSEVTSQPITIKQESIEETNEQKEWTRQEDKMILEAFQREIGTEETFARIRNLMPARSVDQIQGRFQVLMNLLEKVASGSHESHPS